jgi:hypothetical protein
MGARLAGVEGREDDVAVIGAGLLVSLHPHSRLQPDQSFIMKRALKLGNLLGEKKPWPLNLSLFFSPI